MNNLLFFCRQVQCQYLTGEAHQTVTMTDPGSQGYVKPETRGGRVEVHGRLYQQMMKPIVFGNRQKQFNIFTAIVSAGTLR